MPLLNKKSIGLDIADRTIEAVELESSGGGFTVLNLVSANLPEGVVENGQIKDKTKLAEALKVVFADTRFKPLTVRKVVFGLPESQVFLHNFNLGRHDKKDRDELILQEVKLNVPIKEDDLVFSYKILSETLTGARVLIVATNGKLVKEWLDFFKSIDIEVEILDIETLAIFRGLYATLPQKPVCVLDMGSRTTNICIFDQFGLRYSFASFIAGDALTQAIARARNIDVKEAEDQKTSDGLASRSKKNIAALNGELKKIEDSINEALDFFKTETNEYVEEIVMVGGTSQLKGLEEKWKKVFNRNVYLGASRLHYNKMPLTYIEATGLAIRGLDKDWDEKDPSIPMLFKDGKGKIVFVDLIKEKNEIGKIQKKLFDKKTILLISVAIVGFLLLAGAFWFRDSQRKARREKNNVKIEFPEANIITSTTQTTATSSIITGTQGNDVEKIPTIKNKTP